MANNLDKLRSYWAPELIQYGKLESLTGAMVCTNLSNKDGLEADDITPSVQQLVGDEECV